MYGKFVNNRFERAPFRITEAEALAQGYKPVVLTPAPETDNTHMPVERLEDMEDKIVRHWELVELPPEPDPGEEDATAEDYEQALADLGVRL